MEINSRENHEKEESPEWFAKYVKEQGDMLEKTRGNLMVAATVIAAMTFQIMINPPGGVWQSDDCKQRNATNLIKVIEGSSHDNCMVRAGTSVLQNDISKHDLYTWMVRSSTISFSASMSIILLVVSGFRLRHRMIMAILTAFMIVAVLSVSAAYVLTVTLVHNNDAKILDIIIIYFAFWGFFIGLVLLSKLVKFLVSLIRCCRGQRRRPSP